MTSNGERDSFFFKLQEDRRLSCLQGRKDVATKILIDKLGPFLMYEQNSRSVTFWLDNISRFVKF